MQSETLPNGLTANIVLNRLQQKVSISNARLLLHSAKVQTGLNFDNSLVLDKEQTKTLVLNLINQGGPAFHVGQALYKEYLI